VLSARVINVLKKTKCKLKNPRTEKTGGKKKVLKEAFRNKRQKKINAFFL
jgi:hypothetical protein